VLSVANAAESPTALLARREMQPGVYFTSLHHYANQMIFNPHRLEMDGSHPAATLYHLVRFNKHHRTNGQSDDDAEAQVYSQIANRLAELIDDVYEVGIDRDERRELLLNSHWSRRYIPSGAGAIRRNPALLLWRFFN